MVTGCGSDGRVNFLLDDVNRGTSMVGIGYYSAADVIAVILGQ